MEGTGTDGYIIYSPTNSKANNNDIIMTNFGAEHECFEQLRKVCAEFYLKIGQMNVSDDMLALPYFMLVIDPDKFTERDITTLDYVVNLYNEREYSVLFTKPPKFKLSPRTKRFTIKQQYYFDFENLKLIILNKRESANRHQKKRIQYDKKMYRMLYVLLHLMMKKRSLTTNELCNEFNVSEKTIHRDIEMLNLLGNYIVYNRKKMRWNLEFSEYKFNFEYFTKKTEHDDNSLFGKETEND